MDEMADEMLCLQMQINMYWRNIPDFTYTMIRCNLAIRIQEQELGIMCNCEKTSAQCLAEIKKSKQRGKKILLLHAIPFLILFPKYLLSAIPREQTQELVRPGVWLSETFQVLLLQEQHNLIKGLWIKTLLSFQQFQINTNGTR